MAKLYLNLLLAVYGVSGNQVFGGKDVLFALGNVNATVSVWLDNDLHATTSTATSAAASTTAASTASTATAEASAAATTSAWTLAETATAAAF